MADGPTPDTGSRELADMWRAIVVGGRLDDHRPGAILVAFQAIRNRGDDRLEGDLLCHLSDVVLRLLQRKVKSAFPDCGRELIDEIHFRIVEAMLDPSSADGKALAEHFEARVHFRFLDAVNRQRRRQQIELPPLIHEDGSSEDGEDPMACAGFSSVEVGHVLARISDERKRLAFTMALVGEPRGEIADMFGIDRKTLFLWLREVREFLKTELDL